MLWELPRGNLRWSVLGLTLESCSQRTVDSMTMPATQPVKCPRCQKLVRQDDVHTCSPQKVQTVKDEQPIQVFICCELVPIVVPPRSTALTATDQGGDR
jgi:hypothetical protein